MAKKFKKPFNLLVRSSLQQDSIDKVYGFVMGPGRIIVVLVMFAIIIAFVYRFPLDYRLNDQKESAKKTAKQLNQVYPPEQQAYFIRVDQTTSSVKKYMESYKELNPTPNADGSVALGTGSFYKIHKLIPEIKGIVDGFYPDILISSYNYTPLGEEGGSLSLSGLTSKFGTVDLLKAKLAELDYVSDVIAGSISAEEGEAPTFSIEVRLN